MSRIIGIDLGTTNSCVAIIEAGKPVIIENELGERLTKSVVHILENGEAIVGEHAYRTRLVDPLNTITGIKRFIGRRFNEVIDIARSVPFKVVAGKNNLAMIEAHGNLYSPQMISAMILKSLKDAAERYLCERVELAVITIPAYFNDYQREATKEAGQMAGFNVKRLVNEPTAAGMAYESFNGIEIENAAVFDLGGGTFDISMLRTGDGVVEVRSISGDGFLGGDDFDEAIVAWIVEEFALEQNINLSNNVTAMQRVREAATKAKCDLSQMPQTMIIIPFLDVGERVENLSMTLTREKFEHLCEELFERLIFPCEVALKGSGKSSVNEVFLVGGASRMPKVSDLARRIFGVEPSKSINPDEAIALGAAVQAGVLGGQKTNVLLLDVVSKTLSVETVGGVTELMIAQNTTIPTRKSEIFTTSENNQSSVEVNVLEGDRLQAVDNRMLCRLVLNGIPPAPSGTPQIEVTFDLDANSILGVSAKDLGTGKEERLTVKVSTGLTDYDLSRELLRVRNN